MALPPRLASLLAFACGALLAAPALADKVTVKGTTLEGTVLSVNAKSVSMKTVSNVVHNYEYVSPQMRERVQAAIAELGYRPNLTARRLATGRTGMIALAIPEIDQPYFGEIARQCGERGAVFLAAMIPSLAECDPRKYRGREPDHAPLLGQLKQPEQVLELMPAFRAAGCDRLFYPFDRHMTRQGHRVAAEALALKLLEVDPDLAPARPRAAGSASDGRLAARRPRG